MITNKEKNFISVVLYVHNSENEIKEFLPIIYQVLNDRYDRFEIICVNDASIDKSKQEIEKFAKFINTAVISIVNMSVFQGVEMSMNAGVDLAIGDFVYEFDSLLVDYYHELIVGLYDKALEGYDIVSAVPEKITHSSSKLFYKVFNKYSTSHSNIQHERFRILSRRAINRVKSLNKSLVYRKAVYANCGLNCATVFYKNTVQNKKMGKEEKVNRLELAIDSLILFTNAVQKMSLYISIIFLGITVAIGGYTWFSYFSSHKPVEGWTPLMLFLSIGFFGVFLILTVSLQYLAVILRIVFKKRQYLIESIEKITNN